MSHSRTRTRCRKRRIRRPRKTVEKDYTSAKEAIWPDVWAESLDRHELDGRGQGLLEEIGEVEEPVVRLLARGELHQKIHVAAVPPFVPDDRAE